MSKLYLTAAEADEAARRAIRWLCTSVQQQDVVETESEGAVREIKFRGKRNDTGEWVYGDLLTVGKPRDHMTIVTYSAGNRTTPFVYPVTVGQYTGLQDKNGVEIYEGDILGGSLGGVVAWVPSEARFGISLDDEIHEVYFNELAQSELEVIGNIHDLEEIGECVSQTLP